MELFELFNGHPHLERISPEDASAYGYHQSGYEHETTFLLPVKGLDYLIYFNPLGSHKFELGFALSQITYDDQGEEYRKLNHSLSSNNMSFQIFPAVIQAVQIFLKEANPVSIVFSGHQTRQTAFYVKLVDALKTRLPEPYFVINARGDIYITRDDKHRTVSESAENDVATISNAKELGGAFLRWVHDQNEEKPIKDFMHFRRTPAFSMYFVQASTFGGPDDLYLGFSFDDKKHEPGLGFMVQGRDYGDRKALYYVMVTLKDNPSEEVDMIYKLPYARTLSNLVHELTHYYDRVRQLKHVPGTINGKIAGVPATKSDGSDNREAYYNSPLEFNAYFQQGAHDIMADRHFDPRQSYASFKKEYVHAFQFDWFDKLTDENRRKFDRRLYKLWQLLKDHYTKPAAQ